MPLVTQVPNSVSPLVYDSEEYWQVRDALQLVYDQEQGATRGNHANLQFVVHQVTGLWFDKYEAIAVAQKLTGE